MMHRARLCRFAKAVMEAEARREALEKALAEADSELGCAFSALFDDFLRAPYLLDEETCKLPEFSRICDIWLGHIRRKRGPLPAPSASRF